jgi:hypothetical protein
MNFFESNISDGGKKKLKRNNCSQIIWKNKKMKKDIVILQSL